MNWLQVLLALARAGLDTSFCEIGVALKTSSPLMPDLSWLAWGKELEHPLREGSPDTATNRKEGSPWGTGTLFCPAFNQVLCAPSPPHCQGNPFPLANAPLMLKPCVTSLPCQKTWICWSFFMAGLSGRVVTQIISACMSEKSAWYLPLARVTLWLDFYPP